MSSRAMYAWSLCSVPRHPHILYRSKVVPKKPKDLNEYLHYLILGPMTLQVLCTVFSTIGGQIVEEKIRKYSRWSQK